jgi:hypothetical protein
MARELFTDVDMNHPWVTQHRLPVLKTYNPKFGYVVAVVVPDEEDELTDLFNLDTPTDEDAAVIASYLEYKIERINYRGGFRAQMLSRPLDLDDTINTITILKRKDGSWAYSKVTWEHPPKPFFNADYVPKSVVEILDYIERDFSTKEPNAHWTDWKQDHGIS